MELFRDYKPDVVIGSDHAGFESKNIVTKFLRKNGYNVEDIGCYSESATDYTNIAHYLCETYMDPHKFSFGILICGTGQGMAMTANKHQHVRAGIAWNPEIAQLLRQHNDANVLCWPSIETLSYNREGLRGEKDEKSNYTDIVNAFLTTKFSKEERHARRIQRIAL